MYDGVAGYLCKVKVEMTVRIVEEGSLGRQTWYWPSQSMIALLCCSERVD